MGVPAINLQPMAVEEFFSFTVTRPDQEKWELIAGEPVLNATPSRLHQKIAFNLAFLLGAIDRQAPQSWEAMPGIGVRVSAIDLPEPDLLVRPKTPPHGDHSSRECDDIIVAFEVLSPSTADRDLRWKRNAYTALTTLTHYVVAAQDAVEVVVYARENGFAEQRFVSAADVITIAGLNIALPLSEIYRDTGLL